MIDEVENLLGDFLQASDMFKGSKIELIKKGYNRDIYQITTKTGNRYIAKKGHKSKDHGAVNLNDIKIQSYLNYAGCNFVPEVIYWDIQNDLYIETNVGEKSINFDDLNGEQLKTCAGQFAQIHALPVKDYLQFCEENGFEPPDTISPIDSLNTFGFERFEIAKKNLTDKTVLDWIESHLQQNLNDLQERPLDKPHLKWGDIGENIRVKGNEVYFIDFEFAELGFGSELSYIKIHSHISPDKFASFVTEYSKASGISEADLYEEIKDTERITRVNDVVWAAMKWSQASSDKDKDDFRTLTYKRIKLADKVFSE